MTKVWLGSIFLKDEDGYQIILKSLEHYKKRLRTINSSPELAGAAMFAQIIQQEAMKTYPKVESLLTKIPQCLENPEQLNELVNDVPLLQKSLESYKSDLEKVKNSTHEYYQKLINVEQISDTEINTIENAIQKISSFSE